MAKHKHTMNGDAQNGWYCYQCQFTTRNVELAAAHDGVKIYTSNVFPPIPARQFDWAAWDDNLGADGSPIGRGSTEQQAINDLTEQLAENGSICTVDLNWKAGSTHE
jgi:hypothetical protein